LLKDADTHDRYCLMSPSITLMIATYGLAVGRGWGRFDAR
jgi:hypothetical protein